MAASRCATDAGGPCACLAGTAIWAYLLLGRSADWFPSLRVSVLVAGLVAAVLLVVLPRLRGRVAAALAGVALTASLAGPVAYATDTAATPQSGALPSAGPALPGGFGPGGFARPPVGAGGFQPPVGMCGGPPAGGRGGLSDLLDARAPDAALVTLLRRDSGSYAWVAATMGANNAAGVQLGTGAPVMAIGGFNGSDPTPTLAQFQRLVAQGKVHYFLSGGPGGTFMGAGPPGAGGGASGPASQITSWVSQHFAVRTVGGESVYDLTARATVPSPIPSPVPTAASG